MVLYSTSNKNGAFTPLEDGEAEERCTAKAYGVLIVFILLSKCEARLLLITGRFISARVAPQRGNVGSHQTPTIKSTPTTNLHLAGSVHSHFFTPRCDSLDVHSVVQSCVLTSKEPISHLYFLEILVTSNLMQIGKGTSYTIDVRCGAGNVSRINEAGVKVQAKG
ncbi:hypothetical protein QAD02_017425 [Eretmocerus hayati]|uniref:Uncharacterized protein n=1 Tax=Eretmocerus hayati TaxID=131215 RepID=A0ACC2PEZ1_9HYME|nr:hypothetical protein QAD02_017425 [Eretmocerus hayati]